MNKTAIDWCDYTFNPVTGCLGPENDGKLCPYCYAARQAKRFPAAFNYFQPTFHVERLSDPDLDRLHGKRVFVGSVTDLGASWANSWGWLDSIVQRVAQSDNTFIFLSKQPEGFVKIAWPGNCWVGATVTRYQDWSRVHTLANVRASVRFISCEPLLGGVPVAADGVEDAVDWIIVGAQTGPGAVAPDPFWLQPFRETTIPVFMKGNLRKHWPGLWRQEYPEVRG